jgi:GrpB-like predicted nucleotidyltransferase (UPF0157 family)/GNAT superfamily N-acetyltransferase
MFVLSRIPCEIEHIGSTAVPGLLAKPIVDVAVGLTTSLSVDPVIVALKNAGYRYRGDAGNSGGHVFVRESSELIRTHHVHVLLLDDPQWQDYLLFRDFLRQNTVARETYAAQKRALAARYPKDRKSYSRSKEPIVLRLLDEARRCYKQVSGSIRAQLNIRRMLQSESKAVAELWHRTKKEAYPYLPLEQVRTVDEDSEFFHQVLLPRCDIWVAEKEGQIVGFFAIKGSYIDRLYVSPPLQGIGIGTALIRRAMKLSPSGLELHTHQKNHSARRFYERHGFVAVRFGISPPPEDEPDVEYHWRPEQNER